MSQVATRVTVEAVRFQPEIDRVRPLFHALMSAAGQGGVEMNFSQTYHGSSTWVVLWGPGAPERADAMRRHVAAGGHVIAFDLAYWNRAVKVRMSIDAPHPQAWVMKRDWPRARFNADRPLVGDFWNPTGPIVVAGIGRKAQIQYGAATVSRWEAEIADACRARWPERAVVQRAKPVGVLPPIEDRLRGASLVITWHSNVAVDAIRLGIPVVCRDGAAAAVCPSELPETPTPLSIELRDRFLANLAWFQWAPSEAVSLWAFLRELLS